MVLERYSPLISESGVQDLARAFTASAHLGGGAVVNQRRTGLFLPIPPQGLLAPRTPRTPRAEAASHA
jgi:hypothetical protein